jgi:hypothetical protein
MSDEDPIWYDIRWQHVVASLLVWLLLFAIGYAVVVLF